MEARTRGGFLAVGSLWSICRCKGLYVILGNIEEEKQGGGTECNSMKASEAAAFFYNSGLFRVKKMECGEGWRWRQGEEGESKKPRPGCPFERQPICFWQISVIEQTVCQSASGIIQRLSSKTLSEENVHLGVGLCSCLP